MIANELQTAIKLPQLSRNEWTTRLVMGLDFPRFRSEEKEASMRMNTEGAALSGPNS